MNRKPYSALTPLTCGLAILTLAIGQTSPSVRALIHDASGAQVGVATFSDTADGTRIVLEVAGLTPGAHGVHIHTKGSCENSTNDQGQVVVFGGAGSHFDPHDTKHHGGPETHSDVGHAGDLPNIVITEAGVGILAVTTDKVTLQEGPLAILGRTIIIHANEDNYSDEPALGGSGPRIACGLIEQVLSN